MHSAIYEGVVEHSRFRPILNRFRYRVFHLLLDLDELDSVFAERWLWSIDRWNLACFLRTDFYGDSSRPLKESVLDSVEISTGHRPQGPVRLLTHLRYFGFIFNPVSFYYCYEEDGSTLHSVVADITNTPWGECHAYVLEMDRGEARGRRRGFRFRKGFHISPFEPMDVQYDWTFSSPGDDVDIHMASHYLEDTPHFIASMQLERRPLTATSLARMLIQYPLMTARVSLAIYWQALKLWWKKAPQYTRPIREHTHPKEVLIP
jgi:DUF1365 family protein